MRHALILKVCTLTFGLGLCVYTFADAPITAPAAPEYGAPPCNPSIPVNMQPGCSMQTLPGDANADLPTSPCDTNISGIMQPACSNTSNLAVSTNNNLGPAPCNPAIPSAMQPGCQANS